MFVLPRGRVIRWAIVAAIVLALLSTWRLLLLVCPIRQLDVLRWSLEPRTAQTWSRPEVAALVAENGLENGGPIGEWVGRRLYSESVVPLGGAPMPGGPQPYREVHLNRSWLGTESVTWSSEPFKGSMVLVKVFVQARMLERVAYGRGCFSSQPVAALVERDYVTVPTPKGWRVAYVYTGFSGNALEPGAAMASGTAAAVLAGCQD